MSLDLLTSSLPTTGTLFSEWQEVIHTPQPLQDDKSIDEKDHKDLIDKTLKEEINK